MQILNRRQKNNPVIIGEAGVGKTAIVEGLAQKIVAGDVPENLRDKRLLALNMGAMENVRRGLKLVRHRSSALQLLIGGRFRTVVRDRSRLDHDGRLRQQFQNCIAHLLGSFDAGDLGRVGRQNRRTGPLTSNT